MSEANVGLRKLLYLPWVYSTFQWAVGAKKYRRVLVEEFIRPQPGETILDIGCGTGEIVDSLKGCTYIGFDANPGYIETAQRLRKGDCTFHCSRVSEANVSALGTFDAVLAMSVIHHLDDDEAEQLFAIAKKVVNPGGRLITIDPCYSDDQDRLRKWMVGQDRGQNVRHRDRYIELAHQQFPNVRSAVRHDLLILPYSFCALECRL